MKRIYLLLVLMAISFSSLSAAEGFLSWSVIGFDETEWATGEKVLVAHGEGGKKYEVKVKFGRFTLASRTQACTILGEYYPTISYISMKDLENVNAGKANDIAYSSYVLFEPIDAGDDFYIKKIEFIGHTSSNGTSSPRLAFSATDIEPTGSKYTDPYNYINTLDPDPEDLFEDGMATQSLSFNVAGNPNGQDFCTIDGRWIGVSPWNMGEEDKDGENLDKYQKSIKYIRLNWSSASFGGVSEDRGNSLDLFGFQIYTNVPGAGTSIEGGSEDLLMITKNGNVLEFSSTVDVKVYSLGGNIESLATGVEKISLENLQQGVYIVQAKDIQTGKVLTEKVIK